MTTLNRTLPILSCVTTLLVGCATGQPGLNAGAIAPQLLPAATSSNYDSHIWDNATTFGEVPSGRQTEGDFRCRAIGYEHATGYHPDAEKRNGNTFRRGGFFCANCLDHKKC
ncbi:hypothetical protein [uncultured Thiodictyon sp.]|uniref:hypothetical protein n=1 Tax=uncultured Thiodictyon sp. TaxID=1846217 RepID=UPI0025EC9ABD|nr:hypothetical protein [uncultured Thiodictyon sp.]